MSIILTSCLVLGSLTQVMIDETGTITPSAAATAITNCSSAVVAVNLATAKAEIMTNVAAQATSVLKQATDLINAREDYALVDLYATGAALSETNTSNSAAALASDETASNSTSSDTPYIEFVENGIAVDRTSSDEYIYVTLTWAYYNGSFSQPKILAATYASGEYIEVTMSEPQQVAIGDIVEYASTATLPKTTYSSTAFFKIVADIKAPVDDGKTWYIYTDGDPIDAILYPPVGYGIRFHAEQPGYITAIELVKPQ